MILVTGGLGFIGLHTARCLLDAGEELVLTQYRVARAPDFIKDDLGKRAHVEQLDVMNTDQLMEIGKKYKIDKILHLAVPALAQMTPLEDFNMNTKGLINMLEAARTWEVSRLGLASSIAVYSGIPTGPFQEDAPLRVAMTTTNSTEAYKKTFEIIGSHYAQRTGMEVLMLRIGGIYGPLYHSMANLPSRLVHAALKGEAPALRGNEMELDGGDSCYVKDCGQGLAKLMTAESLPNRTYNIASGRVTTFKDIANAVAAQVPGFTVDLKPGGADKPNNYLSIDRIKADVGYEPAYDINTAIADYVQWLKAGNAQ